MAHHDEVETAYFSLLRARDEVSALRRYEEYLTAEEQRLTSFVAQGEELDSRIDRRLRRAVAHTDEALAEALDQRLAVIRDELAHLPDRMEGARAHVAERERTYDTLRRSA